MYIPILICIINNSQGGFQPPFIFNTGLVEIMHSKAEELEEILTPAAQSENIEIVDVQYIKENGNRIARIFIDKPGGVTMDDCEKMSYIFGDVLDTYDRDRKSVV